MSESAPTPPPNTLYRGIVVPMEAASAEALQADLTPGSLPCIDEHGRLTVTDGNEYGVYMSDNDHMAEMAYATPRRGDRLPDSPLFNWRGGSQSAVDVPRLGVLYQIDTAGIAVRKPFITDHLNGVYNNGFEGDEWIADSIPADNHQIVKLKLGPDMLHPAESFSIEDNVDELFEAIKQTTALRIARLHLAARLITEMPSGHRSFPGTVERMLAKHEAFATGGHLL